jgi:cytochrome c oxidase accessory protein FixG
MFDSDTLIVSYDAKRGEARGPRKRSAEPAELGLGDCIDCTMCVQVCPTGIDIRNGLQHECINCAACVDACNGIMDKMGYDSGLISYTTEHQLAGNKWTWKRPKLIGYGLALIVMMALFASTLITRVPLELDVMRSRAQLYQEVPGGRIQNTYTVKVLNKDTVDGEYKLAVLGIDNLEWMPSRTIFVEAGGIAEIPITVLVDTDSLGSVNTDIEFKVISLTGSARAVSESRFLGPVPAGKRL